MKKMIMTTIAKFTAAGLLLVSVATAQAQTTTSASTDNNTVKYLGTQDDMILFKVSVENPKGNKFSVIVTDNQGNQIFQEVYNDKKFDKRFKVPKTETGKLTFVVRNFKDASDDVHSFEVSDRVTEDVVVTSVK